MGRSRHHSRNSGNAQNSKMGGDLHKTSWDKDISAFTRARLARALTEDPEQPVASRKRRAKPSMSKIQFGEDKDA